jgi:hypothetical protein
MLNAAFRRTFIVAGVLVASPVVLSGCGSSSSGGSSSGGSPAASQSPTTATTAAGPAGAATFDGDFNGVLTMNLCTTGKIGSVQATVDGDESTDYLGSVSATELNFKGPQGGIYATKPGTEITVRGGTFDTDGLVLTDTLITQKSVTVHGDLTCP